jgi:ankyrin repeat protein
MQGGETAVVTASRNGHLPVVQFLVESGANVEAADKVCFTSNYPHTK